MNEYNFSGYGEMHVNGLYCTFHMPNALKSKLNEHGEEVSHGLPPSAPQFAYPVDEYDCPVSWMHGSGIASSYFVGIQSEKGMWLDFNKNINHTHHVAALISVQGVNPLDGQSLVEIEQKICLKQYKMKCPKHDVDFQQDRYCPECKYKWVPQNYLTTTGTPRGYFWLDGFLAPDGKVRQYYFTENEDLGVAHQIIGKEKKVYSIGIAFYLSKEMKIQPNNNSSSSSNRLDVLYGIHASWSAPNTLGGGKKMISNDSVLRSLKFSMNEANVKSLEIGAGAMINQKAYADPESLDFWQEKPAGLLYVNYCPNEQVMIIIQKGKKDLTNKGEGFLGGLKVGNNK